MSGVEWFEFKPASKWGPGSAEDFHQASLANFCDCSWLEFPTYSHDSGFPNEVIHFAEQCLDCLMDRANGVAVEVLPEIGMPLGSDLFQ